MAITEQEIKNRMVSAKSERERLEIVGLLFKEMRSNTKALTDKLEKGIDINNLDEISTSLHNELVSAVKKISKEIKEPKHKQEFGKILAALKKVSENKLVIDKPIKVIQKHQKSIEVSNFAELKKAFDDLSEKIGSLELSVNVDAPKIEVKPPDVNIQPPQVFVEPANVDMTPLKEQLKKIRIALKPLQNNSATKPLAVRLSDGFDFLEKLDEIVENQRQIVLPFPGKIQLHKKSKVGIIPPGSVGDGNKDVASAGTRVRLIDERTNCSKVYITAKVTNTGKIYVGGKTVSETSGTFIYNSATITLEISDLRSVFIDAEVSGEGVQYAFVS